jgi:YHS domain-containing protein
MTEHAQDRPGEASRGATCRVCLKAMAPGETKWTVHYRGTEYRVCCPSCVQLFNRAPGQFVEEP